MKKFVLDFLRRGFAACGMGPIVFAVVCLILQRTADVGSLPVDRVCTGIFSLAALAFLAGGMNAVYRIERLPLMAAILLHGGVLYIGYLGTYLVNGWLKWGSMPVVIFSAIFAAGYLVIWAVIHFAVRRNTEKVNRLLLEKQRASKER